MKQSRVAIMATCILASACAPKVAENFTDNTTLYQSSIHMYAPPTVWDEELQDSVIEWHKTANKYRGDVKTVKTEDLNFAGRHTQPYQKISEALENIKLPNDLIGLFWELKEEDNQTVLHCYFTMPAHPVKRMWLGGEETYIVDEETGVHYKPRVTTPDVMQQYFTVQAPKDSLIDFTITFPPLPESTRYISITGVPNWGLYDSGNSIKINRRGLENAEYDQKPNIRVPQLKQPEQNYNKDDADTWAYYHKVHTIKPLENEKTFALWRTPEATYLAVPHNQTWTREYYGYDDTTFLVDDNGNQYKIKGIQGIPMNHLFWVEECAGDWFALVLEFEPIPLDVTQISYISLDGEPFNAWGANWEGTQIRDMDVETLRQNQKLFEYVERKIVE
ncbi:MAG: hypothetical protein IKA75_02725 [Bacteroidaceae bacterium]|nr:hypothetical protein [Bacteroidaceae bacterium]MBR3759163.1 hypothetical protein [Bacteroidaceae bacterium]